MSRNSYPSRRFCVTTIVGCALLLVALLPAAAGAAPRGLPPRPTPSSSVSESQLQKSGGFIQLWVAFDPSWPAAGLAWQELWTVVQWQDEDGVWREVEGWQGALDGVEGTQGWKQWWFPGPFFGKGPFRWIVYAGKGGQWMAVTEPFDLPDQRGQVLRLEVWLQP